jgi:PEP-CTERM motif
MNKWYFVAAAVVLLTFPGRNARATFTETYDDGTDVGKWVASFNVPRQQQALGGSPLGGGVPLGAYMEQSGFTSSIPTWGTASPRFQPGFNDTYKEDSVFVGDWTAAGVTDFSVDLDVIQSGSWPAPGRPLTLQLMQMDGSGFSVNYVATYTTPLMATPPVGWTHYDFTINADGGAIPPGWIFTRGDGTPATDAEWATFLSRIDMTSIGYYAPGTFYPSTGTWTLGIDNVGVTTAPVPEPGSMTLLSLGVCAVVVSIRCRQ